MSVPAREFVASPRHVTASLPLPARATLRRGASLFMTAALGFQLLGQAMPVLASTTAPAPAAVRAADAPDPVSITLVSGAGTYAAGAKDPSVTYTVGNSAPASPVEMTVGTYPLTNGYYAPAISGTQWISSIGNDAGNENTDVTYNVPFVLPAGYTSPRISIDVLADNSAAVLLNGHPFGHQSTANTVTTYQQVDTFTDDTAADFLLGLNTLAVVNSNYGAQEGVDFKATVTYTPDGATRPELVTNGGFEQDGAGADFIDLVAGSPGLAGWTIDTGSIDFIGGRWAAANGSSQSVDLAGTVPGQISQSFATTNGAQYLLTFAYSANPDGGPVDPVGNPDPRTADVLVNGVTVASLSHPQGSYQPVWSPGAYLIDATGSSTTIAFRNTSSGPFGIALDDVSVVPVNPPSATAAPVLAVAASGVNGGIAGRVQGDAGGTERVSLFLSETCDAGVPGSTQALGYADLDLDADGAALFAVSLPNLPTGQYVVATASADGHPDSAFSNCVQVGASNDSWPNALDIGIAPNGDGTFGNASHPTAPGYKIDQTGQSRWYKFSVAPGETITVDLSNLPADYDVVLFKDITQAYTNLTTSSDLNTLGANFAGQAFSGQAFSAQAFSAQAFSPDAYSAQAFSAQAFSADVFSGQAFSAQAFSGQAFSGQAFSAQAFSGQAFSGQAFSGQAFSGQAFSAQAFSAQAFSGPGYAAQAFSAPGAAGQAFSGQAFSPQAFSSAQVQSVIATSANTGTGPESITANTWNNTGEFYVRVTGKNGAFDPNTVFTLHVTQTVTSCAGVHDYGSAPTAAAAGNFKTVILTDSDRIAGTAADKSVLATRLATLAARSEVAGAVVDVKSVTSTGRIYDLAAQAAANPTCPYAENLLASALKDIVDSYRKNNPNLAYVVLVGGDTTIPFFRYPDEALLAPESGYIPPVLDSSTSQAALQLNYVLSQDAYGAGIQINQNANTFPVPDLAVGRLVETAAEATTMVNAYLSGTTVGTGAVPAPTSSLVTGYDFLSDAATTVKASLDAGTGANGASLITNNGVSPTVTCGTLSLPNCSWDATALKNSLLGARHDLVFLAGHFSANSALAADFSTTIQSTDLAASNVNLTNSIVFSAGCHSGYNLVNSAAVPNLTQPLDWSEAFAQKGATLIAGTGYQYGDTDFEMYSERIYAGFAGQLLAGSVGTPVSVGQALVKSKQAYLTDTPTLRGIDTKALLEATLFGLPMLSVDMQHGRTGAGGAGGASSVTAQAVTADPGATLGLQSATLDITTTPGGTDPITKHTQILKGVGTAADQTVTYYGAGPDGNTVTTKPFEPTLPLISKNVSVGGASLRGVGFWGGTYTDEASVIPLTGAATTELRGVHTSFSSPVFYPMRMTNANYFDVLRDPVSGATNLLVTPVQHRSNGPDTLTSTLRRYDALHLHLFYSSDISAAALAAPPSILDAAGTEPDAAHVAIDTHVVGDPTAGMQEVWVTWTWSDGTWQSQDLTQDAADSTHWSWTLPVDGHHVGDLRFMIQAVNGVGLVGVNDNYGAYYSVPAPTVPNPNVTSVSLASTPAHASFGSTVSFAATLSGATSNDNQPIVFSLGGTTRTALTVAGVATASFQLTMQPATYSLSATFPGDGDNAAFTASRPFVVDKVGTTLTLTGPAASAWNADSGLVATLTYTPDQPANQDPIPLGQRSIYFVVSGPTGAQTTTAITDYLGQARLGTIPFAVGTFTVSAYFDGTIPLLPSNATITLHDATYGNASASTTHAVVIPDRYVTKVNTTLNVAAPGVLALTTGTPSSIVVSTKPKGTLTLNTSGAFSYVPKSGFTGKDTFAYKINGVGSAVPVTIYVLGNGGISCAKCNLSGLDLQGYSFSGSNLSGADFTGAYLPGVNLGGANLSKATLANANLANASLKGSNLSGANLSGANLEGADLSGTNLSSASLAGADLAGAKLSGSNLSKANLANAVLTNAVMPGVNLSSATLAWANLHGATLTGSNLSSITAPGVVLSGALMSGVNLSKAEMTGSDLSSAYLKGSNLSKANLTNSDLSYATLTGTNRSGTILTGAVLTGVIY